jgi:fumarate hydratase class II
VCRALRERCIAGIQADRERCAEWIEWSLALVTPLATRIGYDKAAALAHRAYTEKKTVRQLLTEEKILEPAEIDRVLDPRSMV